jgi:hypothetical protein
MNIELRGLALTRALRERRRDGYGIRTQGLEEGASVLGRIRCSRHVGEEA